MLHSDEQSSTAAKPRKFVQRDVERMQVLNQRGLGRSNARNLAMERLAMRLASGKRAERSRVGSPSHDRIHAALRVFGSQELEPVRQLCGDGKKFKIEQQRSFSLALVARSAAMVRFGHHFAAWRTDPPRPAPARQTPRRHCCCRMIPSLLESS
jgi:hypothetical protein